MDERVLVPLLAMNGFSECIINIIIMLKRSPCGEQRQRRLGNKNQFDSLIISSHTSNYLLIERTRCPTLGAPITMIHHIVCLCRANELLHCWSKMTYEGSNNSIWGMLQWVKVPFDMVLPYRNYVHASLARGWFVSPKEERNECHTQERYRSFKRQSWQSWLVWFCASSCWRCACLVVYFFCVWIVSFLDGESRPLASVDVRAHRHLALRQSLWVTRLG